MILFVCYLRPPPLAAGQGRPPTLPLSPARTVQTPRGRAGAGLSQHPGADQCVSLPNSALSGLTLGSETGCGGRIYTTGISERCEPGLRPTEPAVRRPQAHRRVPAFRRQGPRGAHGEDGEDARCAAKGRPRAYRPSRPSKSADTNERCPSVTTTRRRGQGHAWNNSISDPLSFAPRPQHSRPGQCRGGSGRLPTGST